MRSWVIISILFTLNVFAQKDYSENLEFYKYKIHGLGPDSTPTWNINDTILLLKGYYRGSIEFSKKDNLLMQQDYSRCGNVSFFEGLKLLSTRRSRYRESILGKYTYDPTNQSLIINFSDDVYQFTISRTCRNRGFEGFELVLINKTQPT